VGVASVPGWIRVAADGRLEASEEALEQLARGPFSLLAGPERLLLGVQCRDPQAAPPRALLAGDLARVAFPEIVSQIVHSRISGVLQVVGASVTRRVMFEDGEVRGASSERVGERLSEVIVRMGLVEAGPMQELSDSVGAGRRVGRLAVERGLLSERELWSAVQEHVTTIFQAILIESSGCFVLTDETLEDAPSVPGLSAEGLLMEGVRRLDELRMRGGADDDRTLERIVAAYAGAFRDIFATAQGAGAGPALARAAASVFEDDPAHAALFDGISIGPDGDLPASQLLLRAQAAAAREGRSADDLLSDALSTVLLFLLFVAGEHLKSPVQQALHARVKTLVARD
jgi:hypothetical protein